MCVSDLYAPVLLTWCQLPDDLIQFEMVSGLFGFIGQVENTLYLHLPVRSTRLPHLFASFVPVMYMEPGLKKVCESLSLEAMQSLCMILKPAKRFEIQWCR